MQITPHVYNMHIDDDSPSHPGGNNNFFVGDPDLDMVIIDTGDYQRDWSAAIINYYIHLGRPKISSILITHGHMDHIGGLDKIQEATNSVVRCHPLLRSSLAKLLGNDDIVSPLEDHEKIPLPGGSAIQALYTPGHSSDHICYHFPEDRVMFTGDTVLGASSTSVQDLRSYLRSLELLTKYDHEIIGPGHGPVVPAPRGSNYIKKQIEHRQAREDQIISVLQEGLLSIPEITNAIYPKRLLTSLRSSAERNVGAHLDKLVEDRRVNKELSSFTLRS